MARAYNWITIDQTDIRKSVLVMAILLFEYMSVVQTSQRFVHEVTLGLENRLCTWTECNLQTTRSSNAHIDHKLLLIASANVTHPLTLRRVSSESSASHSWGILPRLHT